MNATPLDAAPVGAPPPLAPGAPVDVAIVDDHLPVRAGLPPLLERDGIHAVVTCAAAPEDLPAVVATAPAVALVALGGAERSGLGIVRRLGVESPATAVLVLTDAPGELDAATALAAGAAGVLWKGAPLPRWGEAVRAVASGRLWLEDDAAPVQHDPSPYRRLSERERRVLLELARGSSTEEAAVVLHLSPHTVRTHVRNIQRKLGARTRVHALALALSASELRHQRL